MKLIAEFDEREFADFLKWRKSVKAAQDALLKKEEIDVKYGRTEIGSLDWPVKIKRIMRDAGIETVEQAANTPDNDLLKTPACGRIALNQIRKLVASMYEQ